MIVIYTVCGSKQEAQNIGKYLVEKRLAACVNILDAMNSFYWWPPRENQIIEDHEAILLIKTKDEYFDRIREEFKTIHSYECPCFFSIKIDRISEDYEEWLESEMD